MTKALSSTRSSSREIALEVVRDVFGAGLAYGAIRRGEDLLIPLGVEGRDGFFITKLERRE